MFSSNNIHKVSDSAASIKTFNQPVPVQLWKTTTLDGTTTKVVTTLQSKINNLYIPNNIYYGGSLIHSSDIRLKSNIELIDNSETNKILQLKPYKYNFVSRKNNDNKIHYGFIAQDVEQILPNIVTQLPMSDELGNISYSSQEEPLKGIDYNSLIPFLVSHAQQLQTQINTLNIQVEQLTQQLTNNTQKQTKQTKQTRFSKPFRYLFNFLTKPKK